MSRMDQPGHGQPPAPGEQSEQTVRGMAEQLGQMGQQVRQRAREKLEDLRHRAAEYYQQKRERASQLEEDLEDYVQAKPIKSLLIAAGVGFVLGVIWKRR